MWLDAILAYLHFAAIFALVWFRQDFQARANPGSLLDVVVFVPLYLAAVGLFGFVSLLTQANHLEPRLGVGSGLKTIYGHTSLPMQLYPAFRVAFDVAREAEMDGGENDRQRFAVKVIERILTQFDDLAAEDLDYLLTKLNQLAA